MFSYKIYNSLGNSNPYIIHSPDISNNYNRIWKHCVEHGTVKYCTLPEELSIITFNSSYKKGILENQLDKLKVNYTTLGKGINWKNHHNKITLINENIDRIKTKYVLVCDCYDVLVVRDLSSILENFISIKKQNNVKIIFNATVYCHPNLKSQKNKEESFNLGRFQYLNSGIYIGETSYVKDFFSKINLNSNIHSYDDQCYVKEQYFKDFGEVAIDNKCQLFQVLFDSKLINDHVFLLPKVQLSQF